jgi:hypothetical protein
LEPGVLGGGASLVIGASGLLREIQLMKRISISAALLVLAVAVQAHAAFLWDVTPSAGDQLSIKLQNWEPDVPTVAAGGLLYGVGRVTTIENLTTGDVAWSPSASKELTFIFKDFALNGGASTPTNSLFDGGRLDLYFHNPATTNGALANKLAGVNGAPGPGTSPDNPADTQIFLGGTLEMTLAGNPGITGGHTEQATITGPTSGTGRGYLDVVPGSGPLAPFFDTTSFPTDIGTFSDFNLHTTLQPTGAAAGFYPIFSNDPVNARYGVPEPMSLVLVGQLAGLIGLVAVRRSRRGQ